MKRLLPVLSLFLLIAPLSALAPGDNLTSFWKVQGARYSASRVLGPFPGWPGYETAVLATDVAFSKAPFVLVLRKVGGAVVVPFGSVEGPSLLVVDTDGDGLLDLKTGKTLVPGWLALKIPGPRGDAKGFQALGDRIYRQYNRPQGPVPAQLSVLVDDLKKSAVDPNDGDRDLASALLFYLEQGAGVPAAGTGTLAALALALKGRGGVPPLVYLFLGETLEDAGLMPEAQAAYDRLLERDPKSLIGGYKKARIDPVTLKAFRQMHPDFWAATE